MGTALSGFSDGAAVLVNGFLGASLAYNNYLNDTSSSAPSSTAIQADLSGIDSGLLGMIQGALSMASAAGDEFSASLTPLGLATTVANLSQIAQQIPEQINDLENAAPDAQAAALQALFDSAFGVAEDLGSLLASFPPTFEVGITILTAATIAQALVDSPVGSYLEKSLANALSNLLINGWSAVAPYAHKISGLFDHSSTDPLVIDLSGNGVQLVSLAQSNAYFDLHDTGYAVHTGWVGPETGILVDDHGSGTVNNIY